MATFHIPPERVSKAFWSGLTDHASGFPYPGVSRKGMFGKAAGVFMGDRIYAVICCFRQESWLIANISFDILINKEFFMGAGIKYVSDASFEQDVLKSDKPVLLDFWAEWCGPCKMIGPILEELSTEYGDKIQIAKMNVDENQGVPAQFNIRGIPTLILFKGGAVAAQKVGALSKSQLAAFIDGNI
jgi:thioredoxin 1